MAKLAASDVLLSISKLSGRLPAHNQTQISELAHPPPCFLSGGRDCRNLFLEKRKCSVFNPRLESSKCGASPGNGSLRSQIHSWRKPRSGAADHRPGSTSSFHSSVDLPPWNSTPTSIVTRSPLHSKGDSSRAVQSSAFGGVFRSKPTPAVTEQRPLADVQEVAGPGSIRIAYVLEQGRREEMEDEISVVADVPGGFVYAGVFDGHVGTATARFLRDELYSETVAALGGGAMLSGGEMPHAAAAITDAFVQFDQKLITWLEAQEGVERESGSTGTIVFVRPDRIFVACVGDTRAVMGSQGEPTELSEDHRPFGDGRTAKAEIKRLKDAGCWVTQGRVCGSLAVSRAFGDIQFKSGRKEMLMQGLKKGRWTVRFVERMNLDIPWVTSIPDVYHTELKPADNLVIVGSDGLWDVVKSSEAVRFVQRRLEAHGNLKTACEELLKHAIVRAQDRKSSDNVSIVLIELGKDKNEVKQ